MLFTTARYDTKVVTSKTNAVVLSVYRDGGVSHVDTAIALDFFEITDAYSKNVVYAFAGYWFSQGQTRDKAPFTRFNDNKACPQGRPFDADEPLALLGIQHPTRSTRPNGPIAIWQISGIAVCNAWIHSHPHDKFQGLGYRVCFPLSTRATAIAEGLEDDDDDDDDMADDGDGNGSE